MLLIVGGAWLIFTDLGLLLEPVVPSLSAGGVFMSVLAVLYFTSDREKRFIRQAFGQYLVPELVRKLEESPGSLKLGGETRRLSIMFLDIRGFTGISEALSADELVTLLNRLFSPCPMRSSASRARSTNTWRLDHGVLERAGRGVRSPVARLPRRARNAHDRRRAERGGRLRLRRAGEERSSGEDRGRHQHRDRLRRQHGLGTALQLLGRRRRRERRRAHRGELQRDGLDILISESVAEAVPDLAVLEAGEVVLRGKSRALKLFALVGDESLAETSEFRELARLHASLLAAAEVGRSDARAMLETCRALAGPWFAPFYARLEERLVSRARHLAEGS